MWQELFFSFLSYLPTTNIKGASMDFSYTQVELPDDAVFKISPSQIDNFFSSPVVWYKEQILGQKVFEGSTATELGTIIHAVAEAYAKSESTSRDEIEEYLLTISNPDVDKNLIRDLYPMMAEALINEYVSTNPPTEVEYQTLAHVKDGVYVGGTVDNRTGTRESSTIVDYKNVSTKPNTNSIPFGYKIQMLAYAYADRERGIDTDRIRLVYTVRPTKTLPVRVFVVNHMIQESDWLLIEGVLDLIAESVLAVKKDPTLTHLIFKSMSLKKA